MTPLRVVLLLTGALIATTGINVGFGGIATLGWQGPVDYVAVTNTAAYAVHDSHVRFLGGVWLGLGLLLMVLARNPRRNRARIGSALALVFVGGLVRLFQFDAGVLFSADVVGSLLAELIGIPLLYLWLAHAASTSGR